jgi:hypothetical protein
MLGYNKGTSTLIFIAALFTIAKLWKQPRCPTTDEWIKKMLYLYIIVFYSVTKKNGGKWIELENIILSDVSQVQRPKATCSLLYVECRPNTNTAIL